MKKVNLLLAAVVAASMSSQAFAVTPNVQMSGYMRAGVGYDKNGTLNEKHSNNAENTTTGKVGRLGNENGLYGELKLSADVAKVEDTLWTFNTMFAYKSHDGNNWDVLNGNTHESNGGYTDGIFALEQTNIEVKGLFDWDKDAMLWVGKRFIQEQDSYVIDNKYYNVSGTGFGIEGLSLGSGKLDLTYSQVGDKYNSDGVKSNVFDAKYNFPVADGWSVQIADTFCFTQGAKDLDYDQENGNTLNLHLQYADGKIFNRTVFEYLNGANAASDGHVGWGNVDGGNAYKLMNFGTTSTLGNTKFGIAHHAQVGLYNKADDDNTKKKMYQLVLRPYYQLTKMTKVITELGAYGMYTENDNDVRTHDRVQKATLAYAIAPDASNFWSRPEIRFFVTYLHGDKNLTDSAYKTYKYKKNKDYATKDDVAPGEYAVDRTYGEGSTNITFGVQVEAFI